MPQPDRDARSQSDRNTGGRYIACLVRLWQDGSGHPWHASVQWVQGGEVIRFASMEALFDYLKTQTDNEKNK